MIRHHRGGEFFLFAQHDHALLAGRLAEQICGSVIARPSPATIKGIALHDCGWPLHDDRPTINPKGEPLHVFETPPSIATRNWTASARRAANLDPYSGLLVSLHVLHLSLMSQASHPAPQDIFELNKFQHAQIELQEELRPQVGLRIDRPLTHGLAPRGISPAEDQLLFDFRLLRAMDALSLALLCSEKLSITMDRMMSSPSGPPVEFSVTRPAEFIVGIAPWPFDAGPLEHPVPFRRVAARRFVDDADLQDEYAQAPVESATVRVQPPPTNVTISTSSPS
jgi:hypothetical protein